MSPHFDVRIPLSRNLARLARPAGLAHAGDERSESARVLETARRGQHVHGVLARPAGFEPATPGLEARRKETTGGSGKPLSQCSRASSINTGNRGTPRTASDCLPFVSQDLRFPDPTDRLRWPFRNPPRRRAQLRSFWLSSLMDHVRLAVRDARIVVLKNRIDWRLAPA